MSNALDLVMQMRRERIQREETQANLISKGFDTVNEAILKGRALDIAEARNNTKSPSDELLELSQLDDAMAKTGNVQGRRMVRARMNMLMGTQNQPGQQPSQPVIGAQPNTIGQLRQQNVAPQLNQQVAPTNQANAAIGQVDEFGDETEESKQARKDLEAGREVSKQVLSQESKIGAQASREFLNQDLKIDNHMDSFFDFALRQKEISGLDPGPLSGAVAGVMNTFLRSNEFQDGFMGSAIEVAAATARIAMPGTRAIRAITIFKDTVADEFDTIENGIQNSVDSLRQGLVNDMASSINEWVPNYDNLSRGEQAEAREELKQQASDFEDMMKKTMMEKIYRKGVEYNEHVLKPETVDKLEASFPEFGTEEEAISQLDKGSFFRLSDGSVGVV